MSSAPHKGDLKKHPQHGVWREVNTGPDRQSCGSVKRGTGDNRVVKSGRPGLLELYQPHVLKGKDTSKKSAPPPPPRNNSSTRIGVSCGPSALTAFSPLNLPACPGPSSWSTIHTLPGSPCLAPWLYHPHADNSHTRTSSVTEQTAFLKSLLGCATKISALTGPKPNCDFLPIYPPSNSLPIPGNAQVKIQLSFILLFLTHSITSRQQVSMWSIFLIHSKSKSFPPFLV